MARCTRWVAAAIPSTSPNVSGGTAAPAGCGYQHGHQRRPHEPLAAESRLASLAISAGGRLAHDGYERLHGRSSRRVRLPKQPGNLPEIGGAAQDQAPAACAKPNSYDADARRQDLPAYVDNYGRSRANTICRSSITTNTGAPVHKPDELVYLLSDGAIHPNQYGHIELAKLMFQKLGIFDPASRTCKLFVP